MMQLTSSRMRRGVELFRQDQKSGADGGDPHLAESE